MTEDSKQFRKSTHEGKRLSRNGYAWLVFCESVVVIIACIVTAYIAMGSPYPNVDDYYQHGIEINRSLKNNKSVEQLKPLDPAIQARNHARIRANKSLM